MEDKEIVRIVKNWPEGCEDQKKKFVEEGLGLKWGGQKITVTFEIDVDKITKTGPSTWTKELWQKVLTEPTYNDRDILFFSRLYRHALTVVDHKREGF